METVRFDDEQVYLGGPRNAGEADLALFADRVRARLGANAVMSARLVESHLPERAVTAVPYAAAKTMVPSLPLVIERPIRLLRRPEPVEVAMAEVPEGPPNQFRWRRVLYRVARAEGPERIAPEWWRSGKEDKPTRDYFRVEDEEGRRFWLYRRGLYG